MLKNVPHSSVTHIVKTVKKQACLRTVKNKVYRLTVNKFTVIIQISHLSKPKCKQYGAVGPYER